MGTRTGWVELARRLGVCLFLAGALATYLMPAPALIRVAPVDFASQQRRELLDSDRRLPLSDYIAKETENRLIPVQGPEWQAFFQAVAETAAGRPPNGNSIERRSAGGSVLVRPDEAPLNRVTGQLGDGARFAYLALVDTTPTRFLGATYLSSGDLLDEAPATLAYPLRQFSLWLALLALALYALPPRPRHPPQAVTYSSFRAVLLPDLLGFFLFAVFFALPILVIPRASGSTSLFDLEGGWVLITLFSWGLALFGIVLLRVATWYAVYQVLVLPDRLRVMNLLGQREWLYDDITRVDRYIQKTPRQLLVLGTLVSLFNWRAVSPTLLASRDAVCIEISSHGGDPLRIQVDQLQRAEQLLRAFHHHSVPVTPDAEALLAGEPAEV